MDQELLSVQEYTPFHKEQEVVPRAQAYHEQQQQSSAGDIRNQHFAPTVVSIETTTQQQQVQGWSVHNGALNASNGASVGASRNTTKQQQGTFGYVMDVSIYGPLLLTKEGDVALVIAKQSRCCPNFDLLAGSRLLPLSDISSVAVGKSTSGKASAARGIIWLFLAIGIPLSVYFQNKNNSQWRYALIATAVLLMWGSRDIIALLKAIFCCTPFSIRIDFKNGFSQCLALDAQTCCEDVDALGYINKIADARKNFHYGHGSANVNVIREFTLPKADWCSCDDAPSLTVTDEYILHKFAVRGSANCHMIVLDDVGEIYLGPCVSSRAKAVVGCAMVLVATVLGVGVGVTAGEQDCDYVYSAYSRNRVCTSSNTAAIIGGVCGAILLLLVVVLCFLRKYCIVVYPKMHPGAVSYGSWSGFFSTGYPISFICANNKEYPREIYNCIRNAQQESSRNRRRMSLAPANGPNTR